MKSGAIPDWLRFSWLCFAPLGLTFAGRIAWEKTVWTVVRGPQMVGFSLAHIHPDFFILGLLSAGMLMLWLLPAAIYAYRRREDASALDLLMILAAALVTVVMLIPDTLFA